MDGVQRWKSTFSFSFSLASTSSAGRLATSAATVDDAPSCVSCFTACRRKTSQNEQKCVAWKPRREARILDRTCCCGRASSVCVMAEPQKLISELATRASHAMCPDQPGKSPARITHEDQCAGRQAYRSAL